MTEVTGLCAINAPMAPLYCPLDEAAAAYKSGE
jgi:hypothetical protein